MMAYCHLDSPPGVGTVHGEGRPDGEHVGVIETTRPGGSDPVTKSKLSDKT
jgi:hypothetical protein